MSMTRGSTDHGIADNSRIGIPQMVSVPAVARILLGYVATNQHSCRQMQRDAPNRSKGFPAARTGKHLNPWESLRAYRRAMRLLLPAILAAALLTASSGAAELTHDITELFKDPDSVKLADIVIYAVGGGRKAVCGNVSVRDDNGGYTGFRPFRILTGPGSDIADPDSFLIGNDMLTVRRVVRMCGTDHSRDHP
jgi:hypothetical protein